MAVALYQVTSLGQLYSDPSATVPWTTYAYLHPRWTRDEPTCKRPILCGPNRGSANVESLLPPRRLIGAHQVNCSQGRLHL